MHEYPLTTNIIETAAKYAEANGAVRVKKICMVIGEASGILGESIQMYFDLIAKGTVCENAEIEIEWIEAKLRCQKCERFFKRKPFSFSCPATDCGGYGAPTQIGHEFYIKYIETGD